MTRAAATERWRRRGGPADAGGALIYGHRGASAQELENTLAAFARAAADGADGVELDVLVCASGEVVVFHDDDLQRLAGREDRVQALRWQELRAVTLARGERIPTLDAVFEACGLDLLVNVELKSAGFWDKSLPALVRGVSAVLDRCGVAARVLVSSFDPRAVGLWQRERPDVPAALLIEDGAGRALGKALTLPLLHPAAVHPEVALCRPDLVNAWRATGYLVNTWTVDDAGVQRALDRAGVDGIITNDPAAARRALVPASSESQ